MFRRGNAGARGNTAQDDEGEQGLGADGTKTAQKIRPAAETAKGRPTPKRSEERRAERIRKQQALRQGEDWALLPRDRGPVKQLARDYVDSKRHLGEYLFYVLILVIILTFTHAPIIQTYSTLIALVLFVIIGIEVSMQVRAIRRLASVRLPGENTRGLSFYVAMRTINPRKLRSPAPRFKPGQQI